MPLEILVLVFLVTCFFSFGVQSLFYLWFIKHNPTLITKNQHVFQYTSGVIGDGVMVPLTNVFAFMTLQSWLSISLFSIAFSLTCGVLITFIFHYGQQYFRLTNWTMPRVGKWNTLGVYHGFFMFFESSFLSFTLFQFLNSNRYMMNSPIKYGFLVLFIFTATFIYDYRNTLFKKAFKTYFKQFKTRLNYLLSKIPDLV